MDVLVIERYDEYIRVTQRDRLARADGCQWHAVRHSDRVCYRGARGIHHRRR